MDTPKIQVLGLLGQDSAKTIIETLEKKLDKSTATYSVYATNVSGDLVMKSFSQRPKENAIPSYSGTKTLKTEAPEDDLDCANKAYVDPIKKKIDKIEGMLIDYTEDSAETYTKSVPTNAARKAILNSIGGKTVKKGSKNICTDAVEGGIPFTAPLGRYYILNIPLSAGTYSYYVNVDIESEHLPSNERFWDGGNVLSNPFTLEESRTVYYEIENFESYCTGDVTGKLYLNIVEGTEIPTEYEPYEKPELVPTKVTEIVSKGVNLAHFRGWSAYSPNSNDAELALINGYGTTISTTEAVETITVVQSQNDSTNSLVHYKNGFFDYVLKDDLIIGKKYRLSFDLRIDSNPLNSTAFGVLVNGMNGGWNNTLGDKLKNIGETNRFSGTFTYVKSPDYPNRKILEFRNCGMDLEISNVMITEDVITDITYRPLYYRSYVIPEALRCSGNSILGYVDTVDFAEGKKIQKVETVILNGKEEYIYDTYSRCMILKNPIDKPGSAVNALISNAPMVCLFSNTKLHQFQFGNKADPIENYGISSIADWKAYLASNPIAVTYALATPIIESIDTSDFDKFIEVEGGGKIVAENENGTEMPVPWTVTFAEV